MWASVLVLALIFCSCSELYGFSLGLGSYREVQQSYYEVLTHCEREGGECIEVDFNRPNQAESKDLEPTTPPPTVPPTSRAPPPPTKPLSNIIPIPDPFVPFVPNSQPPILPQQAIGSPPLPPTPQFVPKLQPQILLTNIPNMLPPALPNSVPQTAPNKTQHSVPMLMSQSSISDPFMPNKQSFFLPPKQTTSASVVLPKIPQFVQHMIPAIPQTASKYIPNFIKPVVHNFLQPKAQNTIKKTFVPPPTAPMNPQAPAAPKFAPLGASQNTQIFASNPKPPKPQFKKYVPQAAFKKANAKMPKMVPPLIPPIAQKMMRKYAPAVTALGSKPVPPNSPVFVLPADTNMVPKGSLPLAAQAGRQSLPQAVLPHGPTYEPLTGNEIFSGKGNRLVLPAVQQPVPQTPKMLYFPRPAPALKSTDAPTTTAASVLKKKKKSRKGKKARRVLDVEQEPESRQRRAVGQEDPLMQLSRECLGGWEFDLGCGIRKGNVCCYPASARRRK